MGSQWRSNDYRRVFASSTKHHGEPWSSRKNCSCCRARLSPHRSKRWGGSDQRAWPSAWKECVEGHMRPCLYVAVNASQPIVSDRIGFGGGPVWVTDSISGKSSISSLLHAAFVVAVVKIAAIAGAGRSSLQRCRPLRGTVSFGVLPGLWARFVVRWSL